MLKKEVSSMLEQQVNRELFSSYLYLDMSSFYESKSLPGFANWFRVQAKEELDHALLFFDYLHNNGDCPRLAAVAAPGGRYESLSDPLEASLSHEQGVTAHIHAIYDDAAGRKDFRTLQFLDWFVREQGEEEKTAADLLGRFALFGGDGKGLFLLDGELAGRVYAPVSLVL